MNFFLIWDVWDSVIDGAIDATDDQAYTVYDPFASD